MGLDKWWYSRMVKIMISVLTVRSRVLVVLLLVRNTCTFPVSRKQQHPPIISDPFSCSNHPQISPSSTSNEAVKIPLFQLPAHKHNPSSRGVMLIFHPWRPRRPYHHPFTHTIIRFRIVFISNRHIFPTGTCAQRLNRDTTGPEHYWRRTKSIDNGRFDTNITSAAIEDDVYFPG